MGDVEFDLRQFESLNKKLLKAAHSKNNQIAKQSRAVLNNINAKRVKNVRKAIKPFSYTGRLAKSVKRAPSYIDRKDKSVTKGRIYYGYQEFFGGGLSAVKKGRYTKSGKLIHSTERQKGIYYAHIPEYGRRKGKYKGRHFLWSTESGLAEIAEYEKALFKAVEQTLLF